MHFYFSDDSQCILHFNCSDSTTTETPSTTTEDPNKEDATEKVEIILIITSIILTPIFLFCSYKMATRRAYENVEMIPLNERNV